MSRLTHSDRIGGRGTKTRRCAPVRAIVTVLAASIAVLTMGDVSSVAPIGFAFAQTPGTSGPISLGDLFTTDRTDLKPGAADKLTEAAAQVINPGECPRQAKFKVTVKQGDPIFQRALAQARRDVLQAFLQNQVPSNLFEVKDELGSKDDVQVDYDRMRDREKPKLHTTSVPPKGSKVKPGDQITVTMVARDDANRWQTGIQRIQLIAQNPGGDTLVGAQDYAPVIRPNCEGRPEPRTLVLTYTVPQDPPPIVRLRAITEDFVNLSDFDIGEFPTGDWYGTIKKTAKGGGHNHTIDIDYAFEIERSGTLKGSARARITTEGNEVPGCTLLWTYSPSEFEIPLGGRRDGEEFEITLKPGTTTATIRSIAGGCLTGGGQTSNTFASHLNPAVYPQTKYRIPARDGATDTIPNQTGALPWGVVMHDTIHLHQARQ